MVTWSLKKNHLGRSHPFWGGGDSPQIKPCIWRCRKKWRSSLRKFSQIWDQPSIYIYGYSLKTIYINLAIFTSFFSHFRGLKPCKITSFWILKFLILFFGEISPVKNPRLGVHMRRIRPNTQPKDRRVQIVLISDRQRCRICHVSKSKLTRKLVVV